MTKKIKRWIKNEDDLKALKLLIGNMQGPFTLTIEKGIREKRSSDQNRLQRLWINEAAEQDTIGMTAEEYRAYCKLHFGVPMLRNENDTFAELYDEKVRDRVPPFSYEQKLEFMAVPWDMHVTRLMTVKQHDKYLNMMHDHFTNLGMILTIPSDIDWEKGGITND
ncbi:hypothetical protein [Psychrobacter sp. BI730]|uniref:hypothetical protein n=1 Tax=Psychrobacter sp. BI730 TaxID=2705463 RepID=UPI0015C9982B|nr:hypothetical protein [Psychrobacter sp. BI730]NYR09589.1 hypothetical protein [Psychrobacter sp. BI730]